MIELPRDHRARLQSFLTDPLDNFICDDDMSSIAGDFNRIHVMSGGAPKEVFALLAPRFEEQTDSKVEFTYAVITELREKLSAGATADVLVLPTAVLELNGAGSHHLRAHAPYAHSIRPPIQC